MFDLWRRKRSASVAKNRLSIAIMSDRGGDKYPFMDPNLRVKLWQLYRDIWVLEVLR